MLSWYPRFSRDKSFLPTLSSRVVVPLLSPLLTGIYADPDRLTSFILLDLPSILLLHCRTYWQSRQALLCAPHLHIDTDAEGLLGGIYHARLPLLSVAPSPGVPAIPGDAETPYRRPIPSGQYTLSPLYLTALSDALLRLHLPPEEYSSSAERIMAREILGRTVLGAVGRKVGEGWFFWTLGVRLLGPQKAENQEKAAGSEATTSRGAMRWIDLVWIWALRIWALALMGWTSLSSLFARYTAAPPVHMRYRNCAQSWISLSREILGVDGRQGLTRRRWILRISWGIIEGVLALLGPFIDRSVDNRALEPEEWHRLKHKDWYRT